jgi:hypothetical protein
MSASDGDEAVNQIEGTDEAEETLTALIRAAFPHERVPLSAYQRAARTVCSAAEESAWMRVKLAHGLDSLQALADGRFTELTPQEALPLLLRIQHTTFFGFVRQTVVVSLYEDEEVWEVLGYEGPSFEKGGYLNRGFDDLDWLPDPRIEEYDGEPLQDVVSDLPRAATTASVRGAAVPAGQSKARAGRTGGRTRGQS